MIIELDLTKVERGLRTERVRVVRNGKVFYREQRVGQKEQKKSSGRLGTGKIASLPKEIKDEILDARKLGDSGAKIKDSIENMLRHDPGDSRKGIEGQTYLLSRKGKDVPLNRNLVKEGLINEKGKLTITGQALTDWAKVRGVEPHVKRHSGLQREKEAHKETKKYADKLRDDLTRAQVENKELKEKVKQLEASKNETEDIRNSQRRDILELQGGKKTVKEDVTPSKELINNQKKKIKELYDEVNKRDQKIKVAEKENAKLRGKVRDIEITLKRMMEKK